MPLDKGKFKACLERIRAQDSINLSHPIHQGMFDCIRLISDSKIGQDHINQRLFGDGSAEAPADHISNLLPKDLNLATQAERDLLAYELAKAFIVPLYVQRTKISPIDLNAINDHAALMGQMDDLNLSPFEFTPAQLIELKTACRDKLKKITADYEKILKDGFPNDALDKIDFIDKIANFTPVDRKDLFGELQKIRNRKIPNPAPLSEMTFENLSAEDFNRIQTKYLALAAQERVGFVGENLKLNSALTNKLAKIELKNPDFLTEVNDLLKNDLANLKGRDKFLTAPEQAESVIKIAQALLEKEELETSYVAQIAEIDHQLSQIQPYEQKFEAMERRVEDQAKKHSLSAMANEMITAFFQTKQWRRSKIAKLDEQYLDQASFVAKDAAQKLQDLKTEIQDSITALNTAKPADLPALVDQKSSENTSANSFEIRSDQIFSESLEALDAFEGSLTHNMKELDSPLPSRKDPDQDYYFYLQAYGNTVMQGDKTIKDNLGYLPFDGEKEIKNAPVPVDYLAVDDPKAARPPRAIEIDKNSDQPRGYFNKTPAGSVIRVQIEDKPFLKVVPVPIKQGELIKGDTKPESHAKLLEEQALESAKRLLQLSNRRPVYIGGQNVETAKRLCGALMALGVKPSEIKSDVVGFNVPRGPWAPWTQSALPNTVPRSWGFDTFTLNAATHSILKEEVQSTSTARENVKANQKFAQTDGQIKQVQMMNVKVYCLDSKLGADEQNTKQEEICRANPGQDIIFRLKNNAGIYINGTMRYKSDDRTFTEPAYLAANDFKTIIESKANDAQIAGMEEGKKYEFNITVPDGIGKALELNLNLNAKPVGIEKTEINPEQDPLGASFYRKGP